MLTVLSLLDDRLRPKGSRDPLAIESIWSSVGRKLVGNLTTVTSQANHFVVALLACRYAHESTKSRPLEDIQERYARAEQLAAYLRLSHSRDASLLGRQLAVANFDRSAMELGMHRNAQILSNQLSYGLWGLYSSALQAAGLIKGSERRLTEDGVELTDTLLKVLGEAQWRRFEELAGQSNVTQAQLSLLAADFVALLNDKRVRKKLVMALLLYRKAEPLQVVLYESVDQWMASLGDGSFAVRDFIQWTLAGQRGTAQLRDVLKQILLMQPVLIFANTVVVWLQSQKGRTRSNLIDDLRPRLMEPFLQQGWNSPGLPHSTFLQRLADAANGGDAGAVVDQIMAQNAMVMGQRGGAAWLLWEGEKLRVRVPVDRAWLPEDLARHCSEAWDYSFFLLSFLSIAKAGRQ